MTLTTTASASVLPIIGVFLLLFAPFSARPTQTEKPGHWCAMRKICGNIMGKSMYCRYDGPPFPIPQTREKKYKELCPQLFEDGETAVCCDDQQFTTLHSEMESAKGSLRMICPACYTNFANFWCQFTCSPYQAEFVEVVGANESYVTSANYYITPRYIDEYLASCNKPSNTFGEDQFGPFYFFVKTTASQGKKLMDSKTTKCNSTKEELDKIAQVEAARLFDCASRRKDKEKKDVEKKEDEEKKDKEKAPTGNATELIIIGVFALVLLALVVVGLCWWKRKAHRHVDSLLSDIVDTGRPPPMTPGARLHLHKHEVHKARDQKVQLMSDD